MPPASNTAASLDDFTVDQSTSTIRFVRQLPVSPEEVFAAWADPEQVKLWWDPEGKPLASCEIDFRVGGAFKFVNQGHSDRPFSGVYREIQQPRMLAFDAFGAKGRVELDPTAGGTRMQVEIACSGPEHLRQFVEMGVAAGTSQTLFNLVEFLS